MKSINFDLRLYKWHYVSAVIRGYKKRGNFFFFFQHLRQRATYTGSGTASVGETRLFALSNPAKRSDAKVLFDPTFDKDVSARM